MARTKGAKDKKPRRKAALSMTLNAIRKRKARERDRKAAKGDPLAPIAEKQSPRAGLPTDRKVETTSVDEFNAAIDAALSSKGAAALGSPAEGQAAEASDRVGSVQEQPPGPIADEVLLTRQAWEGVCRVPFRTLAWILRASGTIEDQGQAAIGKQATARAPDLARPSYVIFEHYAKEYARLNPDDPISLALVATGLVAADIAEEIMEIILVSRGIAKRQRMESGRAPSPSDGANATAPQG